MPLPDPQPGLVIGYAYLRRHEQRQGVREGRKDRPCAIVLATLDEDGDRIVYVVPISHRPPARDEDGIELPLGVKRRLGLDADRSWIVTTKVNRFVWPGYDLRPVARDRPDTFAYGFLPGRIFDRVKDAVLHAGRSRHLGVVPRA